jgi:hypothetical protein
MSTPSWKDKPFEEKPSVNVKFYPSYHTKDRLIGPYVPEKIHDGEQDRKSFFATMDIENLGSIDIECDGKQLAFINYKKGAAIGMNIRNYKIPCEHVYVRPHIKSFFMKFYDEESQTFIYHVMKIVNKTGKGDFVIRKVYKLKLFDQLLSNAIEIDDFTLGSYAYNKDGHPIYQTIFSFNKTYLKIEYLNGEKLDKFTIPAYDARK